MYTTPAPSRRPAPALIAATLFALTSAACSRDMPWAPKYGNPAATPAPAPIAPQPGAQPSPSPSPAPSPSPSPSPTPTAAVHAANPAETRCPDGAYASVVRAYEDGRPAEKGCYSESPDGSILPEGPWISFFENGSLSALKHFQLGVAQGVWKRWNEAGALIFLATFDKGVPDGDARIVRETGDSVRLHFDGAAATRLQWTATGRELVIETAADKTISVEFSDTSHPAAKTAIFSASRQGGHDTVRSGTASAFFLALNDEWLGRFTREAKGFGVPMEPGLSDAQVAALARKLLSDQSIVADPSQVTADFTRFLSAALAAEVTAPVAPDPAHPKP